MKKSACVLLLLFIAFFISCNATTTSKNRVNIPDALLGTIEMPEQWIFVERDGWLVIVNVETQKDVAIEEYRGQYQQWTYNAVFESYERIDLISEAYPASTGARLSLYRFSTPEGEIQLYTVFFGSQVTPGYSASFIFLHDTIDENVLIEIVESYQYYLD